MPISQGLCASTPLALCSSVPSTPGALTPGSGGHTPHGSPHPAGGYGEIFTPGGHAPYGATALSTKSEILLLVRSAHTAPHRS